jgi:peptidylprolyl isomerase
VAAPPADGERTPTGVTFKVLTRGTGDSRPEPQDLVEIHFVGWTSEGKMFDKAVAPSRIQFPLERGIPAWREGLGTMVAGEKRRLWVPAAIARAGAREGTLPPGDLVFDLELFQVLKQPRPRPAPGDVAAIPADAVKRPSGIAYKVLVKGHGKRHPRPDEIVELVYTGWTPDGRMIETTRTGASPSTLRADTLGVGWAEALRLMVEGEKARFWMPARLIGWGGPAKVVVYEVELARIR